MQHACAPVQRGRVGRNALAFVAGLTVALGAAGASAAGGLIACRGADPNYGPCKSPDPVAYFPAAGSLPAVMVANFGLLVPATGSSWQYVCDDVFGQPDATKERRSPNGDIFLPTTTGLQITRDGCTFTHAMGDISGKIVYDVAIDSKNPQLVFAIGDTPRVLWRSTDGGRTFTTLQRFPDGLVLLSLALPATRDKQLYIIGRGKGTSTPVAFSADDGATFTMRDPGLAAGAGVKSAFEFLATDPVSPDVLYLTQLEPDGDRVFRSADGGATAVPLLKLGRTEGVAGLAFGGNSSTLYLAAKDLFPLAGMPPGSLYVSRDAGKTWLPPRPAPEAGPQFNCIVATGSRLFACSIGQGRKEDFMLAYSDDEGMSWTAINRLGDLTGPKTCVAPQCQVVAQWLCDTYTTCAEGQTPGGAGGAAGNAGGNAGNAGNGGMLGGGGAMGTGGMPPGADAAMTPMLPKEDSGCGCDLGAASTNTSRVCAGLGLVFLVVALRRRRLSR
jgi:hypothetical protein